MYGEYSFFSYNKEVDWQNGVSENLHCRDKGLEINQVSKYSVFKVINTNEFVGPSPIQDVAVNQNGRIYFLDQNAEIWAYDESNDHLELITKAKDTSLSVHTSILSIGSLLVTADTEKGKITAFSESNGQVYWEITSWSNRPFHPILICSDNQQYIYVLAPLDMRNLENALTVPKNGRLAVFQFDFNGVLQAIYEDGNLTVSHEQRLIHIKHLYLLNVSTDKHLYVYDKVQHVMIRFSIRNRSKTYYSLLPQAHFSGLGIDSNNCFYLGDSRTIDVDDEENRFIYKFSPSGVYQENVLSYMGRTDQLAFDKKDRLFIWDSQGEMITILKYKKRTMDRASSHLPEGIFLSTSFDTTSEKVKWHKFTLDAILPKETQIRLSYFASDHKQVVIDGKPTNLDEYIMDESIPFSVKNGVMNQFLSGPIVNPKDALFMDAYGRYLWVKIEFFGTDQETPMLRKLRIYFPRMSYLSYLPAVYQEDKKSSDFLERFLAIFEKFLIEMDDQIKEIPSYLNPDQVSGPFLTWLSKWLGLDTDETWSQSQIRELVKKAPQIYRKRGTKEAITKIIEIFTGQTPIIIENFQVNAHHLDSSLKTVLLQLYGDNPYRFFVIIPPGTIRSEKDRLRIQRILDGEKPAFTEAKLVVLEPWIYLDMHTYLGLNTYLSEKSLMKLGNDSYMPSDTLLIDVDRDNRYDIHTRIGMDSELE